MVGIGFPGSGVKVVGDAGTGGGVDAMGIAGEAAVGAGEAAVGAGVPAGATVGATVGGIDGLGFCWEHATASPMMNRVRQSNEACRIARACHPEAKDPPACAGGS